MILRDPVHGLVEFEGGEEKIVEDLLDTRRSSACAGFASSAWPRWHFQEPSIRGSHTLSERRS